jgi:hypothetical protein
LADACDGRVGGRRFGAVRADEPGGVRQEPQAQQTGLDAGEGMGDPNEHALVGLLQQGEVLQ